MKCDRCDNEATVHEVKVHNRKRQERHLCETCAKALGMSIGGVAAGGLPGHIPITHLLNEFIAGQVQGSAAAPPAGQSRGDAPAGVCRSCGLTLNQFRQTGLLGCPDCYAAFESQLAPLLQKAHEGASQHIGKRPMRLRGPETGAAPAPAAAKPAARSTPARTSTSKPAATSEAAASPAAQPTPLPAPDPAVIEAALRQKLAEAVAAERYEEAAQLRDQIARVHQGPPPASPPAASTPAPAKAARKPSSATPRPPKNPPPKPGSGPGGPQS